MIMADDPGSVLLVSAGVVAQHGDAIRLLSTHASLTLVELPDAGYRRRPDADATERRRLGRADSRELLAALGGVRRAAGAEAVAALVLSREEVTGQAGRAWLQRLLEAAPIAGLTLPRATRIAGASDLASLRSSILARPALPR